MISLIQCFKAINNFLVWKDPDSRESEDRNIVARALHIKDQAENNNKKRKNKGLIVFVSDDTYHSSYNDCYVYSLQHSQFLPVAPDTFVSLQQVITA